MIAPDTSVLVAGFATWHDGHESAVAALNRDVELIAHAAVETFSVLTRLPPPHRITAVVARRYLAGITERDYLTLDARAYRLLIDDLAEQGISGGSTYDALVGYTARTAGATLLTRDRRAVLTYERLGVAFELLS